uniref:Uncharacterized protein n=1 Tax=Arundo donax TaxID=35708 RepID=A0A0A9GV26_ARUDO
MLCVIERKFLRCYFRKGGKWKHALSILLEDGL